jgi:hypothetical protein
MAWWMAAVCTVLLILSIRTLVPPVPGPKINAWTSAGCGLLAGAGTSVLTRIARRARQNKGLD